MRLASGESWRASSRSSKGISWPHEARIERLYLGPYLELFGRAQVPGGTVWGNEVPLSANGLALWIKGHVPIADRQANTV